MLTRAKESRKQASITLPFFAAKGLFGRLSDFSGKPNEEAASFFAPQNAVFFFPGILKREVGAR